MTTTATSGRRVPSGISELFDTCDLWVCDSLGGAEDDDRIWLARLRGLALAGAALTLAMSAWKAVGPLTASDLFLAAAIVLLLPRFDFAYARRMWVVALAVGLITVGGLIGTAVTGADVLGSADPLTSFLAASLGGMAMVVCWRPGLEQIKSFGWLWIGGGVISAMVALLIPDLHMFLRPSGLTPQSNHLAIISVILVGVALGLTATSPTRSSLLMGFTAISLLLAAIVASGSRAGLAAAMLVVLLALIATRNRILVAITAGVIFVGLTLALTGAAGQDNALDRLSGGNETSSISDQSRDTRNAAGWERFKDHPVTGVGFADVTEPHNFFLQLGSSAGVLGIIGGVMLIVLALRSYALAVWRRVSEHPELWAMAAGLSAAVIGYLAASMFQNVLWDRNIWIAIALMSWTAAAMGRISAAR